VLPTALRRARLASATHPTQAAPTLLAVPISDDENKQWALDRIRELSPSVVVDIGPGEGTYSDLARAHTPGATWKAVEAWAPYVTEHGLWEKYDHVVISDVRHVDLHSVAYAPTLAIIGDVLEHMSRTEATSVLMRLQAWADHILVSIPVVHHDQGDVGGNWFERHIDHWTHAGMLRALGPGVVASIEGEILGYYLWSRQA
jgi:hypothetical protein